MNHNVFYLKILLSLYTCSHAVAMEGTGCSEVINEIVSNNNVSDALHLLNNILHDLPENEESVLLKDIRTIIENKELSEIAQYSGIKKLLAEDPQDHKEKVDGLNQEFNNNQQNNDQKLINSLVYVMLDQNINNQDENPQVILGSLGNFVKMIQEQDNLSESDKTLLLKIQEEVTSRGFSLKNVKEILKNSSQSSQKDEIKQEEVHQCSICTEGFTAKADGNEYRLEQCQHSFHNVCILQWHNINPTCPICRAMFNEEDVKKIDNN